MSKSYLSIVVEVANTPDGPKRQVALHNTAGFSLYDDSESSVEGYVSSLEYLAKLVDVSPDSLGEDWVDATREDVEAIGAYGLEAIIAYKTPFESQEDLRAFVTKMLADSEVNYKDFVVKNNQATMQRFNDTIIATATK